LPMLGNPKFCDKVSESRYTAPVIPAMQMIAAEPQKHLGLRCLHPVFVEQILHAGFSSNGRLQCHASRPSGFDLQRLNEALVKRNSIDVEVLDPRSRSDMVQQCWCRAALVGVTGQIGGCSEMLVRWIRCSEITNKELWLDLLDIAAPQNSSAIGFQ